MRSIYLQFYIFVILTRINVESLAYVSLNFIVVQKLF